MNESLRHALLRARLSEEEVAARLTVNPKTVRRWLEGRVPYARHRWLLATALGLDEADLWPQLAESRSLPQEIQAIYPHREDIPREIWLRLFGHAQERIDILTGSGLFLAANPEVMDILTDRAVAGVKERICLGDPDVRYPGPEKSLEMPSGHPRDFLVQYSRLRHYGDVEVRVHGLQLTNSLYRSDDECLVAPSVYGLSASTAPVMRLRYTASEGLFASYIKSFADAWDNAGLH